MIEFSNIIYEIVIWLYLLYSTAVILIYGWIGIYALGAVLRYKKENTFTDYSIISANPNAPTFSLIAPAYNEGLTIVDNVRSLLSLYYHNLEIIIVNDGSKDDSMQKLTDVYQLERISFFVHGEIPTSEIRGIYKSKNPAFKKLIVVDKVNGGKADALNVGVNISSGDYLVCIDVDCILEQDAILKLAKPFLEQTDKKVIACGGVIRLANNCKIENGKVTDVNLPKTWLGRSQALEYIRAFVLGRMAWSRASGLILISGAFGAFDRKTVLACGGYDKNTVGEDMELVVRMRRYMEEQNEPYEVVNIPDPLCWTEVPETKEVLRKQRNRWMRGTMETLWKHRSLMFNPKYGKLGMVSLPYWFIFEFMGPLVEFSGYIIFVIFLVLGIINWQFFLVLFALVISTGILYSIYAVLVDLISRQVYTKRKDFLTMILTAVIEPFYFHLIVVKAGTRGFIDYFKKSHSWGEMTRQGFGALDPNLPFGKRVLMELKTGIEKWGMYALVFLGLYLTGTVVEWLWYRYSFGASYAAFLAKGLFVNNFFFAFRFIIVAGLIYMVLHFIKERWARIFAVALCSVIVIMQYVLFLYFSESRNILGADILYYTSDEIKEILLASGMLSVKNIALLCLLLAAVLLPFWFASRPRFKTYYGGLIIMAVGILALIIPSSVFQASAMNNLSEFEQNAARSKWAYFISSVSTDLLNEYPEINALLTGEESDTATAVKNQPFPFLRKEDTRDFLGAYMNKSSSVPNLVLVVVEGLGHAYSSSEGYIGNFTPFIDSLAGKSLYWEHNVSSSGRTFAAIPTLTGSLPFGKNGFLELDEIPQHFNLFNILKKNHFETGFYYGGNASFDRMKPFLEYSQVEHIIEESSFAAPYRKLPGKNGESWGYKDQAVFGKMLETQKPSAQPYFSLILTLSTHNPFLINDSEKYEQLFDARVKSSLINEKQKVWALQNKKQLVSVLNLDDALENFFREYSKRPDFHNTLFVITGDHSMPEITLQDKIDRYHVPLILYSPLLKESKRFRRMVSHFDLAPTLLAYYRENYNLDTPTEVTWIGKGLRNDADTGHEGIPMMISKNQLIDFIYGKYHLSDQQLFQITSDMQENAAGEGPSLKEVKKQFELFKRKNEKFYTSKAIMPDSLMIRYMKHTPKP